MTHNNKPMIGLTPYYNIETREPYMRPAYLKAILAAGGIPVILPPEGTISDLQQLTDTLDGLVFTGGPDVHPFYFGEEILAQCVNVSSIRDTLELALLPLVMETRKPILGICRGAQLLNIGLGGDVYQDIPSQFAQEFPIAHNQSFSYEIPSHSVTIQTGTLLDQIILAAQIRVNSMHHQAVRRLASGLIASAYAPGQLIEAIEMPDYPFFLGVQWHPEYLWEQDEATGRIFQSFVSACQR